MPERMYQQGDGWRVVVAAAAPAPASRAFHFVGRRHGLPLRIKLWRAPCVWMRCVCGCASAYLRGYVHHMDVAFSGSRKSAT